VYPSLRLASVLLVIFIAVAIALGIAPLNRADWLLENALVFITVPLLVLTARRFPFSRVSYICFFVFLCLHELGSHYAYSNVPYREWFGLETEGRNHFDRLVHFSYGLLLAYPIREVFLRIADAKGFWGYFLPLDLVLSTSMIYELIEWGAAEFFGGELGQAYLGTQGDVWDAHKDMALAGLGAIAAMLITSAVNARYQRDFAREFRDSLRIKHPEPTEIP
jgi:putative membrane protein